MPRPFPPLLFDTEDRAFAAWLCLWLAMGGLLATWLTLAQPQVPEVRVVSRRLQRYLVQLPVPSTSRPAPPVVEEVPWTPSPPPPKTVSEPAPRQEALVQLSSEGRMLSRLAPVGQGAARILTVEDDLSMYDRHTVDREVAAADGLRRGEHVARTDRDIGALRRYEVGNAEIIGEARVLVPPRMARRVVEGFEPSEVPVCKLPEQDLGPLMRRLRFCWDHRRRSMPGLAGRVVVGWTIERGRAIDVALVDDTVQDEVLEQCLVRTVTRTRYALEAGRISLPLVFSD